MEYDWDIDDIYLQYYWDTTGIFIWTMIDGIKLIAA